ncbi:MAG: GntR family transcriptional regulator [Bryobacteraceae bacterium]
MPRLAANEAKASGGRKRSLSDQAYQAIRERILHGELTVGTELSRRSLADELRVSPIPVMEALQRLEHDGLVESRPRVGTRVRIPTAQDISDEFTLREALEVHSARIFSQSSTPERREELRRLAMNLDDLDAQIERTADSDHRRQLILAEHRLHMRLHLQIAMCAGCRALTRAIEVNQTVIFKWLLDMLPRQRLPDRWHETLIAALDVDDPEAAESAMRAHVRHGLANVMRTIEHLS